MTNPQTSDGMDVDLQAEILRLLGEVDRLETANQQLRDALTPLAAISEWDILYDTIECFLCKADSYWTDGDVSTATCDHESWCPWAVARRVLSEQENG